MAVHDEAGGELRVEVSALGREEDAAPGVVFYEIERGRARTRSEGARADLDGGEIPSGREAVVAIGKKERRVGKGGLQFADAVSVRDWPELMAAAEAVQSFEGRRGRGDGQRDVIAPEPERAGVGLGAADGFGAGEDAVGERFLVRVDGRFVAVEQTYYAIADVFFGVAGEAEGLPIEEEGRFGVLEEVGQRKGLFFARDVDLGNAGAGGSERQDDGHLANFIRVTGRAR